MREGEKRKNRRIAIKEGKRRRIRRRG